MISRLSVAAFTLRDPTTHGHIQYEMKSSGHKVTVYSSCSRRTVHLVCAALLSHRLPFKSLHVVTFRILLMIFNKRYFNKRYFRKTLFFPTTTYSGLCSSHHTCMKILFLAGFLGLCVIYPEKHFGVHRSPPKIM